MDRSTSTPRHRLRAAPSLPAESAPRAEPALPPDPALPARVARWVDAGLITAEQRDAILAAERAPAPARGGALLAEALGYVGGVLVLVAVGTLSGRYWVELGSGGRIAGAVAATAALLGGGAAFGPARGAAGSRLRAVTWLLAVATAALALGLVATDVLSADGRTTVVLATGGAAVLAAGLWWHHRTGAQHGAAFVAAAATAGAAAFLLPRGDAAVAGLAVWGVGTVWMLLGRGGLIPGAGPRSAQRLVALIGGGTVLVVGVGLCAATDWGSALALVSAAVLVAAGAAQADLALLAVGSVLTLVAVPVLLGRWFPDALVAPLALLAVGVGLVGAALGTVRRRQGSRRRLGRPPSPRTAVALAVAVVLGVTAAVVALGLRAAPLYG